MKDTHARSSSSGCEGLLAADIKSLEQELKQMDNDRCQFAFWIGKGTRIYTHLLKLAFLIKSTMWIHCICTLLGYRASVQTHLMSLICGEHLDCCRNLASLRPICIVFCFCIPAEFLLFHDIIRCEETLTANTNLVVCCVQMMCK